MKIKLIIPFLFILFCSGFKHQKLTPQQYIEMYANDAVREMKRAGVPASITLAQGMLESSYGNSELARKANNHFGIKCHSNWEGKTFKMDDDKKNECFRVYKSVWASFRDHSNFLTGKKRYASLFELKITDYKGWAKGLRKAGYATNPKYAKLLIELIERYELDKFDKGIKRTNKPKKKPKKKEQKIEEESEGDEFEVVIGKGRSILMSDNFIKYIVVKKGDTFYRISKDTEVTVKRLYKYNEWQKSFVLAPGTKIYLQPKKSKGRQKRHMVKNGETLYSIAQMHGIKTKKLAKRNLISESSILKEGSILILRGKKK